MLKRFLDSLPKWDLAADPAGALRGFGLLMLAAAGVGGAVGALAAWAERGFGWPGAASAATMLFFALALAFLVAAIVVALRPRGPGAATALPLPEEDEALSPMPRIALLSFVDVAARKGWDITGRTNVEIMDLLFGLRQAAHQGTVRVWGRPNRGQSRSSAHTELHHAIPGEHWREFEFDVGAVVGRSENFDTTTYNRKQRNAHDGGFVDLYVDRRAALAWLEADAQRFKGTYAAR